MRAVFDAFIGRFVWTVVDCCGVMYHRSLRIGKWKSLGPDSSRPWNSWLCGLCLVSVSSPSFGPWPSVVVLDAVIPLVSVSAILQDPIDQGHGAEDCTGGV